MNTPFLRTAYNYDTMAASDETALHCKDESLAIQSGKDEADINTIVKRFGLTGEMPSDFQMPQSGDFTGAPDFHSAMNLIRNTQEQFLKVPAHVRDRFQNDPARLMSFIEDNNNYEEASKLGLLKPKETAAPLASPPAPAPI